MSTAYNDQYVQQRLDRLTGDELRRVPNKWIAQLPQFGRARSVLDIACGLGFDSIAWARSGKRPVGIDFNFDLVKNAAKLAAQEGLKIDFVVGDATRLPFRDESFDASFSENLFEHVPAWQKIVEEANRVLTGEGIFFVRTTNRHCPFNPEIRHFHFYPWFPQSIKKPILNWIMRNRRKWVNYTNFPAVNWFTHRGLARFLERLGFETYEVLDLVQPEVLGASKRKFFFLLRLMKKYRLLRYLVYPLMTSVQVLGVKRTGATQKASCAPMGTVMSGG